MKNKILIISLLVLLIIGLIIYFTFFFTNSNTPKTADYEANRTEANVNNTDNEDSTNSRDQNSSKENESENDNESKKREQMSELEQEPEPPQQPEKQTTETEIASFSTKIYTKDANRQNNVRITCSSLNDTLVENGATFSFCNTVGQATTAKGYKKAEIFDAKRK